LATFSYVVVLMLENRSFDNLLGNLYAPGELPSGTSFEGVIGKNLSNPIPAGVPAPDLATSVPVLMIRIPTRARSTRTSTPSSTTSSRPRSMSPTRCRPRRR
jgi:hypothetical protein